MDMLASTPFLMSPVLGQPLSQADLSNLPAGTIYSVVSETNGNGICTRFTQITKAAVEAMPKVVSQSSDNCGNGQNIAEPSQPTQAAKAINLRTTTWALATRSMWQITGAAAAPVIWFLKWKGRDFGSAKSETSEMIASKAPALRSRALAS